MQPHLPEQVGRTIHVNLTLCILTSNLVSHAPKVYGELIITNDCIRTALQVE